MRSSQKNYAHINLDQHLECCKHERTYESRKFSSAIPPHAPPLFAPEHQLETGYSEARIQTQNEPTSQIGNANRFVAGGSSPRSRGGAEVFAVGTYARIQSLCRLAFC